MPEVKQELIDDLASLEVDALLEGLNDPELRRNPAFLDKVRKFLKDNKLTTTKETPGLHQVVNSVKDLPVFKDDGLN